MKTLDNNTVTSSNKTANKVIHKRQSNPKKIIQKRPSNNPEDNGIPLHKLYAGISSKFIKCIWEQHDKSDDMEVSQDVFSRLSEDVTYKLWELANTMKTYSRHSGGHLSVELVNEILKDSNVSPILGTFDGCWDKIEYDRTYYFQSESIVDLSKEFLNEKEQPRGEYPSLSTLWVSDKGSLEKLVNFSTNICEAIFLGNPAEVSYAIDITYSHPQIGCIAKILLKKCIEMLAIEYTQESLERSLMLICALAANPKSRDADIDTELLLISELFICLLLGPINTQKEKKNKTNELKGKKKAPELNKSSVTKASDTFEIVSDMPTVPIVFEEYQMTEMESQSDIENGTNIRSMGTQLPYSEAISLDNEIPTEIPNREYEAFFAIMQELKKGSKIKNKTKFEENQVHVSDINFGTNIYTKRCTSSTVGLLCRTIGNVGSRWGIAEEYLITATGHRIDVFFQNVKMLSEKDNEWFCRLVHGLWALGELAFRKILVYIDRLNPKEMPDLFNYHLNFAAIFIKGSRDSLFYAWLYEICGDSLLPFMIYYQNYLHKLCYKSLQGSKNFSFKIYPTVKIYTLKKTKAVQKHSKLEMFPEYISVKKITLNLGQCCFEQKFNPNSICRNALFGSKIVVGKRRSMKILTNQLKYINYNDLIMFNL